MANAEQISENGKWRFTFGIILLILAMISPIGAIFVGYTTLSTGLKLTLSGFFLAGFPEILTIAAVAVLGKEGFSRIKASVLKLIRKYGPPKEVGRLRYNIGLVMFILPMIYGWLIMYVPFERFPAFIEYRFFISVVFDLFFLGSFLVLGGNFWDKVRALFIHKAKVNFEA